MSVSKTAKKEKRNIKSAVSSEIDSERSMLIISDRKTGAKNVCLPEDAVNMIKSISHGEGASHVLPGKTPGERLQTTRKPRENICKTACIDNLRLHVSRYSFAGVDAACDLSLAKIGALPGHSQPNKTRRCAHLTASP